jgi:hypothetical protein
MCECDAHILRHRTDCKTALSGLLLGIRNICDRENLALGRES